MRSESTISKWGNSLAVRIPLAIAKQASLGEGDSVTLCLERDGGIILRPAWLKVVGERGWIVLTKIRG